MRRASAASVIACPALCFAQEDFGTSVAPDVNSPRIKQPAH